jgi:methionyl-tRNA formyltransferase
VAGDETMRIVMMGTGQFARPTFEALLDSPHEVAGLVTQPDRAAGQERGSTRQTGPSLKEIAQARGIPVRQPESIKTPEGIEAVAGLSPELLIVAAYGQILPDAVLAVAPNGGINVHASLLPRYRGAAPIAWAIYHGEARTGVTIIRMSVTLDAGDMLAQKAVDILPDETAGELEARLAPLGARLALEVIDKLAAGPVQGQKQDAALVTKAPKLKKEHGVIDWALPAGQVCRQVRAMQPWPTAYTFWHHAGQAPVRLIVCRASSTPGETLGPPPGPPAGSAKPGEILPVGEDLSTLRVAAGGGSVVHIHELQPAGKRRMSAEDFLRGRRPQAGDRLGPETS